MPKHLIRRIGSAPSWILFVVGWVLLAALSTSWSLATPISASPDEPSHIVKAASVVRGEFVGAKAPAGIFVVHVPRYIAFTNAQTCYVAQQDVSAACIPAAAPGDPWTTVDGTTSAGLYNPVYYTLVGWPSLLFHDSSGIFAMRIVSGVISTLFLALGLFMISTWKRRVLPVAGIFIASTPMIFFLDGSVNPNSLEIAATLAVFVAMVSIVTNPDPARLRSRLLILAIAASLAVNMRGLSPIWVAVAIGLPLILASRAELVALFTRRSTWVVVCIIGIFTAGALAWLVGSSSLTPPDGGSATDSANVYPFMGALPIMGFVQMAVATMSNFDGMIGVFGWLDSVVPPWIYALWYVLFGLVAALSFVVLKGRRLVFAVALGIALFLIPAAVQAAYITSGGVIWQGRYSLPLLVMVIVGCSTVLSLTLPAMSKMISTRIVGLVLAAWAVGQIACFIVILRRYAVGATGAWSRVFLDPQWQPPLGTITLSVAFIVIVAVVAVLAVLWAAGQIVAPAERHEPQDPLPGRREAQGASAARVHRASSRTPR